MQETLAVVSLRRSMIHEIKVPSDVATLEVDVDLLGKSYVIALINKTRDICYTVAGTRPIGGTDQDWKWTSIPKTCPNCRSSYDDCFKQGRYSPIMTTDCQNPPFELFVGYFIDASTVRGAVFDIQPNCNVAGGVIGITD